MFRKVSEATKLRSHKKKDYFPNEQMNDSIYLLIFGLIYAGFIGLFLSRKPPLPKKIEGKI